MLSDVSSPIRRKKNTISICLLFHFWTRCQLFIFFSKRVKAIKSIISQSSGSVHLLLCLHIEPEQSNKGGKILSTVWLKAREEYKKATSPTFECKIMKSTWPFIWLPCQSTPRYLRPSVSAGGIETWLQFAFLFKCFLHCFHSSIIICLKLEKIIKHSALDWSCRDRAGVGLASMI